MNPPMSPLEVLRSCPGRAIHVQADGTLYLGRNLDIYRSTDDGQSWQRVMRLPCSLARRAAQSSRLACRLLRHEVKALASLPDGGYVASNRQGVFYAEGVQVRGESEGPPVMMCPGRLPASCRKMFPPMTLTVGPGDRVIWGEYNSKNNHGLPIRIFVSEDHGRSYEVAHVFEAGSILHIHNLVYDRDLSHYWVLAGDHENEPGIGRLSADLKDFEWLVKGEQEFRAVEVFDFGDHLIYGMDSDRAANAVIRFDKASGRTERLQELDGSCIYACRFGGLYVLSTTVEPSRVNHSRAAGLWVSRDGDRWERVLCAEKDFWHPVYFQFGSLVLPRGASEEETILFSGQALKGLDGRAYVAQWRGGLSEESMTEPARPAKDGGQPR